MTELIQIGSYIFNTAQIVLVYLGEKTVSIEFAIQDGDGPREVVLRGAECRAFLAWWKLHDCCRLSRNTGGG